uniref:Uncharacterized protein n=3 Tax=unclassified bacterial viruses TaxID=12333 RepID=A0AAU6VZQ8_9VIRU
MPCYDSRDHERQVPTDEEDRRRLFKEWHHNSPVAELLCWTMKSVDLKQREVLLMANPKLGHWWRDHQERDKSKAQKERERNAANNKKIRKQIRDLQAQLKE